MAFDQDGLFKVLGKFIKTVNVLDIDLEDLYDGKIEIRTVMDSETYMTQYHTVPELFEGFQSNLSGIIQAIIGDSQEPFLDEALVLSQLRIATFDFEAVLDGIHDYFTDNSESVLESIVTIEGADVDLNDIDISSVGGTVADPDGPKVFVTRDLDGWSGARKTAGIYAVGFGTM